MNKSKKYMYIGIMILIISLVSSVGTYAWFTWNSINNTSLTLSIGKLADVVFTSGNDINISNLSPVYNYTDGEYTTFTIENRDNINTLYYTVKLEITSIDTELRDESFKYTLVQDNTVVKEGNLSLTKDGMTLNINTSSLTKASSSKEPSTSTFKLYFWIDGNMENNPDMMDKSLIGKINVDVASNILMGYTEFQSTTSTFLGSDIIRENISSVSFIDNIDVPEGLTTVDVSLNQDSSILMWYTDEDNDGKYDMVIGSNDTIYVSSGELLFNNLTDATSIDLSNFDTSNVTNMSWMFYKCYVISLDVTNFDTSNVTDMDSMFYDCYRLKSLDLSSFDTSKVTNMDMMFYDCGLTSLDLSSFDTSKVTNMSGMFRDCSGLTSLDLSSFDTSNVTTMSSMFFYCKRLTSLDLSSFDKSKVISMCYMFCGCSGLTSLDLSNFDTSNVTNMYGMFSGCTNLVTIDLRNADFSNVTDYNYMFSDVPTSVTIYLKDTEGNRNLMSNFSSYSPIYV